jgi:hypothetical protein
MKLGYYQKLQLIKNGASREDALSICRNKNKVLKDQYVVIKEGDWYNVMRHDTVPKDFRDNLVRESICAEPDCYFMGHECLICERPICKCQIYAMHDGPR